MDVDISAKQEPMEDGVDKLSLRFITNDYLFLLLRDKLFLHLHVFWIVTVVTILAGGVAFGLPALAGARFGVTGIYLYNTIAALLETTIPPLFFLLYLLLPGYIADLFNTLNANGAIGQCCRGHPGMTTYGDFQKRLMTWANKSWWTWGILLFLVFYWFYQILVVEPQSGYAAPRWLSIPQYLIFSLVLYTAFFCLVRIIITLIFTNWLFHMFTIHVNPLHPDGSGGLGILGRILWLSAGVMFLVGLGVSLTFLPDESGILSVLDIALIGLVYLVLIPSLLIGWLWLPHRTMMEAREAMLLPWAKEFDKLEQASKPEEDLGQLVDSSTRLKTLKERYELLRDTFPIWPLQFVELRRLVLTFTLPPIIQLSVPYVIRAWTYLSTHFPK